MLFTNKSYKRSGSDDVIKITLLVGKCELNVKVESAGPFFLSEGVKSELI